MKRFSYNGKKNDAVAFGYDFSRENKFCADVPKSDTNAIKKLTTNRFFDEVELTSPEAPGPKVVSVGVFKRQQDNKPYSKPEKTFSGSDEETLKEQALAWMEEKDIGPDERLIMVK